MSPAPRSWHYAHHLAATGEDEAALRLALALLDEQPGPELYEIAASILARHGETAEATRLYRAGLTAYPNHPILAINGARLLREQPEHVDEALAVLDCLITHDDTHVAASHTRIETLRTAAGRPQEAESAARGHVARFPEHGGGRLALALALLDQGKLVEALAACDDAVRFTDVAARAWELAANVHVALGDAPGAARAYRAALGLAPDPELHSRLLMSMMYCDDIAVAAIHDEAALWAALHLAGIARRTAWPHLDFDPARPLRVGFLSGDFRLCSTPFLAFPLWHAMPARWTVTLYDTVPTDDAWNARFRAHSAEWRDISMLDNDAICDLIERDRIDILFDLNGHTQGGRPGVFHRKPAPVQIAWLDYVGTTGITAFSAIVGDARHIPLAEQPLYVEPIYHVRDNLYRYTPPDDAPAVSALPALRAGRITFGCFNSAYKLSATTLDDWAAILSAVPDGTLLLNSREYAADETRERILRAFTARGVAASRVVVRPGATTPADLMAAYGDVDIALDPAPYSGGLTTLEAAYMGAPTLTRSGDRFGSRHAMAHMRTLGLDDWVADDRDAYVALAVTKSRMLSELAALRADLRGRLQASPLCDGARLASDLDALVATLWANACFARRE